MLSWFPCYPKPQNKLSFKWFSVCVFISKCGLFNKVEVYNKINIRRGKTSEEGDKITLFFQLLSFACVSNECGREGGYIHSSGIQDFNKSFSIIL